MVDFDSKYSGEQVEALLDQVASGNAGGGGGGGITVETDPIFSASPAASITEDKIEQWDKSLETYVADFTVEELMSIVGIVGAEDRISCDLPSLAAAMNENKVILVRESRSDEFKGVCVLNGYIEDLLYFSVITHNGNVIACIGNTYAESILYGSNLELRDWNDLVTYDALKTINGESIVGDGDITIAGGSGEKGDKGDKGDTGVGVQSVAQTTTSNADGGSNVVTVTLTDGTKSTFTVKNGSKGSQGIQGEQGPKGDTGATGAQGPKGDKGDTGANGTNGTNGKDGADGEDGATFTPSVDSAGNLSWSNDKGLANPPTVNIKGPKGDAGEGGGSSGGGGVETISLSGGFGEPLIIEEMLAEKRYFLYVDGYTDSETIEIQGFEGHEAEGEVTIKHFYAVIMASSSFGERFDLSLILPDVDIRWANGGHPSIVGGDGRLYELSITRVNDYGICYYNAVLTPFNYVE